MRTKKTSSQISLMHLNKESGVDNIGIVFGCFIPFHKGHESLVERALKENDRMIIAVCGYQEDRGKDFLPFTVRYKLVKEMFREDRRVTVALIDDKKIGLDVAMEALRDGWRKRKFTADELMAAARVDRVERVIRPYAEGMLVP